MKLIYCTECYDVVKLARKKRYCSCKKSWGKYLKYGLYARIGGECIPLGFNNRDLADALRSRPEEGIGYRFEAFVIPKQCPTIRRDKEKFAVWGLRCKKCTDEIYLKHRHDCRSCKCGAIYIDGGRDYCRVGGHPEDMEHIEIILKDSEIV